MEPPDNDLTKVFVELPEGAPFETESFWAKPLGDDLYELRNSPWFAFDLHFYYYSVKLGMNPIIKW